MRHLPTLFLIILIAGVLAGCSGSGGGGSPAAAAAQSPAIVTPPSGGGGAPTVSLTYYKLSDPITISHAGSAYHVTVTGSCVSYLANDYCWDDGYKIAPGLTSSFEQSFWGLCNNGGTIEMCSGGATTDPMTAPYLWTSMVGLMPTPLHQITDVYTLGIAVDVTCTVSGSVIDCVDFQIDTSNAVL